MNEYPPRPIDEHDLQEDMFGDAEFQNSLHAMEEHLGIVATAGQIEIADDAETQHSSSIAAHSAEDIDSLLDEAYGRNQAYSAILEEGDKVHDEAANMNEEHDVNRAAELRQLIDDALIELQQAEDEAKAEEARVKESEVVFAELDSRTSKDRQTRAKEQQTAKTPQIENPQYANAVLDQAQVARPTIGQARVDSVNGDVIVEPVLKENTLTIVHPQIGGESKVTTYNFDPDSDKLIIESNGATTVTSVVREPDNEIRLGRKKIALPPSVAEMVGFEFVLAA